MDKKARLLRFACVLVSLELAIMIAALVTGAIAPCGDAGANATPSRLECASNWLMLCHNILEIGFYAVFAWLLIDDNGPYAVTGFLFALIGLIALSLNIFIELEFLHRQPQPAEPFGFGYSAIEAELGLIGQFSILPAGCAYFSRAMEHLRTILNSPAARPIRH